MPNNLIINKKIKNFNKKIEVDGDKSLSIRWILFSSLASTKSTAQNILLSEDVMAAINTIRKFDEKISTNVGDKNLFCFVVESEDQANSSGC